MGRGLIESGETVMKTKAAIQIEYGGPLVVEEIDIPDPGPDQVTVRNFASGVCYSQVHQLRNPGMPRPMGRRIPINGLPGSRPTGATFQLRSLKAIIAGGGYEGSRSVPGVPRGQGDRAERPLDQPA